MKKQNDNWIKVTQDRKLICYVLPDNDNFVIYPPNESHSFLLVYRYAQDKDGFSAEVKSFDKLKNAKKVGKEIADLEEIEKTTSFLMYDIKGDLMQVNYNGEEVKEIYGKAETHKTYCVYKKGSPATNNKDVVLCRTLSPSIAMGFMTRYMWHAMAIKKYKELKSDN